MNKLEERRHVIDAMRLTSEFPGGILNSDDRESPDFILLSDDRKIGIEHTTFIRGTTKVHRESSRATEVTRNKIMVGAKKIFDEHNKHLVQLTLQWHFNRHIPDRQAQLVSENIAALIKKYVWKSEDKFITITHDELELFDLDKYLFRISISPSSTPSVWCQINAAWIEAGIDEIQQIIDEKNRKIREYLKECDSCFLLIVADGNSFSTLCELTAKVLQHKFHSDFQKILFYTRDPFSAANNVFRLNQLT